VGGPGTGLSGKWQMAGDWGEDCDYDYDYDYDWRTDFDFHLLLAP
jgi:hypothetical protein